MDELRLFGTPEPGAVNVQDESTGSQPANAYARIAVDARSNRTALTDPYPWLPTRLRGATT